MPRRSAVEHRRLVLTVFFKIQLVLQLISLYCKFLGQQTFSSQSHLSLVNEDFQVSGFQILKISCEVKI